MWRFGKIFLCDSDNWRSHVISSCKRGMCTMEKRKIRTGKKMFQFNQFPICICYSEVDKIHIFLKKEKDWWILWTDVKVSEKEVNYDAFSYHKQKQEKKKAYRADRKPTKHMRKKDSQNVDTEDFNWDTGLRKNPDIQKKPFATFLSTAIFLMVTVSKVVLIRATVSSVCVVLSLFNFEPTKHSTSNCCIKDWQPTFILMKQN